MRRSRYSRTGYKFKADEEKIDNRDKWIANNTQLAEWMEEIHGRIPWNKNLIDSLWNHIDHKGSLTDGQSTMLTNLYIDSCVWTDEKICAQQEARKMLYRLCDCRLGKSKDFVWSVFANSSKFPLSLGQYNAVMEKVAPRFKEQLELKPEIEEDDWDGWHRKG